MENPNAGVGTGRVEGKPQAGQLSISLAANVVLALVAIGLGIWGWSRHQYTKELNQRLAAADQKVAAADQKVVAANEERDEAYQTSRDLQNSLINVKSEMKGQSNPFQPQRPAEDDDATPP